MQNFRKSFNRFSKSVTKLLIQTGFAFPFLLVLGCGSNNPPLKKPPQVIKKTNQIVRKHLDPSKKNTHKKEEKKQEKDNDQENNTNTHKTHKTHKVENKKKLKPKNENQKKIKQNWKIQRKQRLKILKIRLNQKKDKNFQRLIDKNVSTKKKCKLVIGYARAFLVNYRYKRKLKWSLIDTLALLLKRTKNPEVKSEIIYEFGLIYSLMRILKEKQYCDDLIEWITEQKNDSSPRVRFEVKITLFQINLPKKITLQILMPFLQKIKDTSGIGNRVLTFLDSLRTAKRIMGPLADEVEKALFKIMVKHHAIESEGIKKLICYLALKYKKWYKKQVTSHVLTLSKMSSVATTAIAESFLIKAYSFCPQKERLFKIVQTVYSDWSQNTFESCSEKQWDVGEKIQKLKIRLEQLKQLKTSQENKKRWIRITQNEIKDLSTRGNERPTDSVDIYSKTFGLLMLNSIRNNKKIFQKVVLPSRRATYNVFLLKMLKAQSLLKFYKKIEELDKSLATDLSFSESLQFGRSGSLMTSYAYGISLPTVSLQQLKEKKLLEKKLFYRVKNKNGKKKIIVGYNPDKYYKRALFPKDILTPSGGERGSVARAVPIFLGRYLLSKYLETPKKEIRSNLIHVLKTYRKYIGSLMVASLHPPGINGMHRGPNLIASYYYYPSIPYATAAVTILLEDSDLTREEISVLKQLRIDFRDSLLSMMNKKDLLFHPIPSVGMLNSSVWINPMAALGLLAEFEQKKSKKSSIGIVKIPSEKGRVHLRALYKSYFMKVIDYMVRIKGNYNALRYPLKLLISGIEKAFKIGDLLDKDMEEILKKILKLKKLSPENRKKKGYQKRAILSLCRWVSNFIENSILESDISIKRKNKYKKWLKNLQ